MIQEGNRRLLSAVTLMLGGVLLGLTTSKHSLSLAYNTGFSIAEERYARHYTYQMHMFNMNTNRACMRLWFNNSDGRMEEARRWMCQYTDKKGKLQ
jgi:hypothetical protein